MRDRDKPIERRATTTLVKELRDHASVPPAFFTDSRERAYAISSSYHELARREVDADSILRCGLGARIEAGVMFSVLAPKILETVGIPADPDEALKLPDPDPAWLALLDAARTADGEGAGDVLTYAAHAFAPRVRAWLATAPLDDVINWIAPDPDTFLIMPAPPWTPEDLARATWLLERFSETFLDEWSTDSLEMEWGYLHGELAGCCPAAYMKERRTDASDVAAALAERHHATWRERRPSARTEPQFSATDFTVAAAENLAAGRQKEAAAIFAAVLRLSPESTQANNNFGFCILPTDAARSLAHLEKASKSVSGTAIEVTNAANRVLALHLLDRDDDALQLAELALAVPGRGTPSYLWSHGPGPLKLVEGRDPRTHLEQVYEHIRGGTRWDSCRG